MEPIVWIWLAAVVVFAVAEMATTSLTTIWFAGGALVAFIMSLFDAPLWAEIVAFLVVSVVMLIFTRPVLTKVFKTGEVKTNVEGLIGTRAKVIVSIDNSQEIGYAVVNGQEWTARSADDDIIPENEIVEVVGISGVKLIVRRINKEQGE